MNKKDFPISRSITVEDYQREYFNGDRLIFSGSAYIEMQGEEVLHFLAFNSDHVEYALIGFDDPTIRIIDFRPAGLKAIARVLESGKVGEFPRQFNFPSDVNIRSNGTGEVVIELHETNDPNPQFMLWSAIGIGDLIPVYEYVYSHIVPLDKEHYALLSLYKRPKKHKNTKRF